MSPRAASSPARAKLPLPSLTRRLVEAADRGAPVERLLRQLAPELYRQVVTDSRERALLALWGRSRNRDELAEATIVHPDVLGALGRLTTCRSRAATPTPAYFTRMATC